MSWTGSLMAFLLRWLAPVEVDAQTGNARKEIHRRPDRSDDASGRTLTLRGDRVADWSTELRLLLSEREKRPRASPAALKANHSNQPWSSAVFANFSLIMVSPWFLVSEPPALSMTRVVCFCQPIAVMIAFSVTPPSRLSMAITWLVLLPSRGAPSWSVLGAFLAWVALTFAGVPWGPRRAFVAHGTACRAKPR
jgi:hypothetical protein